MSSNVRMVACIALIFFITGCVSTSSPLEMGRDTYSVSATADGFRDAASARQSAFESGRKLCASQGKRFMFVNEKVSKTRMDIDTTVDIVFRCLNENDPEYTRPNIKQAPNVLIEDRR